jgi:SpoVK/Ycf46/Vps4 family AAA+-type ATPase
VTWAKGVLVHGPSGVGKSSAVIQVAQEADAVVHAVTPATLIGQYMGESERRLREIFENAHKQAGACGKTHVILIEEADALFPRRKAENHHEARLVGQLLTLMDGLGAKATGKGDGHVVVVAITAHPNVIDSALRRPGRFDRETMVPVPSPDARMKILQALLSQMRNVDLNVDVEAIASKCHGYTGADLKSLCSATVLRHAYRSTKDDKILLTTDDFIDGMEDVGASVARSIAEKFPPACWDDIGGLEDVKSSLEKATVWPITRANDFKRLGIKFPKGVLLHGPPGCAKTTLARAAATASGATFIPLLGTSLYSMYVGDGEAELRRAFSRARLSSPSVLFIDEIDSLVGSRAGENQQSSIESSTRLLTTFLTEMDGIDSSFGGVLVLATTNRPFAIDSALLRPGRFDVHIFVPPPDTKGRIQALQVHTKNMPLDNDVSLENIALRTENFTGAEIQALCKEAAMAALRENVLEASIIRSKHFDAALIGIKPAHSSSELEVYAQWPRSLE